MVKEMVASISVHPFHKSHNASEEYPTMHHFITEMCTYVHISVTKWYIVGFTTGALWDLWDGSIRSFLTCALDNQAYLVIKCHGSSNWGAFAVMCESLLTHTHAHISGVYAKAERLKEGKKLSLIFDINNNISTVIMILLYTNYVIDYLPSNIDRLTLSAGFTVIGPWVARNSTAIMRSFRGRGQCPLRSGNSSYWQSCDICICRSELYHQR